MEDIKFKISPYKKTYPLLRKKFGKDIFSSYLTKNFENNSLTFDVDGTFIYLPTNENDCFIFESLKDLNEMVSGENFPIEEPEWNPFAKEKDRILSFHNQKGHYHHFLNEHLKFDFDTINDTSIKAYLSKIIGRTIKKVVTEKEIIALISVFGEVLKSRFNAKWFLTKRLGTYNPYYIPNLRTPHSRVIDITQDVESKLKWKISKPELILNTLSADERKIGYDYKKHKINNTIQEIE